MHRPGIDILFPLLALGIFGAAESGFAGPKLPSGFIEKSIGAGFSDPVALAIGPDGSGWLADRGGKVFRIQGDALLPDAALTLAVDTTGDRGLLGMALDPTATAPKLYVAYCVAPVGATLRLSGFPIENGKVDPAKESVLMAIPNPGGASTGLGGGLAFGPDGKLYLGLGDLGQPELAQDIHAVNGKVLRISANGFIPADNPFYATAAGQGKATWSLGFGDPTGLAFNAAGALFVHDAKAGAWQEINVAAAGSNHGWPTVSGPSEDLRFKAPFYAYGQAEGCATRGGDFHAAGRGRFPAEYAGDYFTADLCGNWMRRILPSGERKDFIEGFTSPAALRFGPQGDLYYATKGQGGGLGGLWKLTYAPELSIHILAQPEDAAVQEGESVTFRVNVQGPPPIRYQWRKNGEDIPGATASSLTLASATSLDNGVRFSVFIANDHGSVESRAALVSVGKNNVAPSILAQPNDLTARNGQSASFTVSAEGTPPLRYQWNRKGVPIAGATSPTYSLPTTTLADNGLDFFVEVSNAGGLITSRRALLTVVTTGHNALAEVHKTAVNGRGPVEGDMSNGESDPGDGDMLSIGDRLYSRGLGVYANSEVTLTLSGGCDSLYAEIGVDGERGTTGTVAFEVLADGASLYKGGVMTPASPPVKLALVLTGRQQLKLKVTDAGDLSGNDYANWGDARIKCWENFHVGLAQQAARKPMRSGWYLLGPGEKIPGMAGGAHLKIHDLRGRLVLESLGAGTGRLPGGHRSAGRYLMSISEVDAQNRQERKP